MREQSELAGRLRVTIEAADAAHRALTVRWTPADAETARNRFEYARLFVAAVGAAQRTYLDIVDGKPWAAVRLPDTLAVGAYVIEVDAYGSASWGDGRLAARGRSDPFPIGSSGPVG